jgi:hypothetical protein
MYVSPKYPGRLYAAAEDYSAGNANVYFYESTDGGQSWSASSATSALEVNDDLPSDQFQPSITADANGNVGVAWYDRRNACPTGETNTCIDSYAQLFTDGNVMQSDGTTVSRNGGNVRASRFTWDPRLPVAPAQPNCLDDLPHPGGSCGGSFIGDYFGTAIASGRLYILNISTHDFGSNPNNDQLAVLQIVPIPKA